MNCLPTTLMTATLLLASASAQAQSVETGEPYRDLGHHPAVIQSLRVQLIDTTVILLEMGQIRDLPAVQLAASEALLRMPLLSDEFLIEVAREQVPLADLHGVMLELHEGMLAPQPGGEASPADSGDLPNADYSFCGPFRSNASLVRAAQLISDIFNALWVVSDRVCDFEVPSPVCTNTQYACIAVDIIRLGFQFIVENERFCDAVVNAGEIEGSYERLAFIRDRLVALATKTSDIDTSVDSLDTAINDALDSEVMMLEMVVGIEPSMPMEGETVRERVDAIQEKVAELDGAVHSINMSLDVLTQSTTLIGTKQNEIAQALEELRDLAFALQGGG